MNAEVPPVAARRGRRRLVLRLVGTVVLLGAIFLVLPARDLVAAVRSLPLASWPIAIGLYLACHLIGVVKWRVLINAAGAQLGFRSAAHAYYWGLFGNTFLPSLVGGDMLRAGLALREARSRSGLILGSLVDRVQDVVGLGLLAGIGAVLSPRALDARSRGVFLGLAALLGVVAVVGAATLFLFPARYLRFGHRRRLVQVRRAVRATAARPQALATAFLLGMLLQTLLVTLNWWLGRSIGIDIPVYVWLFVWPLAKISGLLPVTQGGIGVREAAQAALFAPFGVSAVSAIATGLVFEGVLISGGLLSGLIALQLRRSSAVRTPRSAAAGRTEASP